MKKTLVQLNNLEEHVCRARNKAYVDGSVIFTPGAKDELARRGIAVVKIDAGDPTLAAASQADSPACAHAGCCARAAASGCRAASAAPCPAAPANGKREENIEHFLLGLAAVLKSEYGVDDPVRLRELSLRALAVIKENI